MRRPRYVMDKPSAEPATYLLNMDHPTGHRIFEAWMAANLGPALSRCRNILVRQNCKIYGMPDPRD